MRALPPLERGALIAVLLLTACFGEAPEVDDDGDSSSSSTSTAAPTTSSTVDTSGDPASSDASSETTTEDGGSTETSATSETGNVAFCDGLEPYISCVDFEGEIEPWTLVRTMEGIAEIVLVDGAPSGSRVLSTSFPATEGVAPEAYAVLAVPDVLLGARLRFRADLPVCAGEITFASMTFADDDVSASLLRTVDGELLLSIDDHAGLTQHPLDPDVVATLQPWSQWELRVDLPSAFVDVLIDGAYAAQVGGIVAPTVPVGPPTMRIGIARKTTGFACTAHFDDVVVD